MYHFAEYRHTECRYGECPFAECRGALHTTSHITRECWTCLELVTVSKPLTAYFTTVTITTVKIITTVNYMIKTVK
jgi:hypothetical protein